MFGAISDVGSLTNDIHFSSKKDVLVIIMHDGHHVTSRKYKKHLVLFPVYFDLRGWEVCSCYVTCEMFAI
jgi:hypothetical protein